jgi:AcrR family transcriptional regulator
VGQPPRNKLSPPFDLLWGLRDRRSRRRGKPPLSVDRVVRAALELADADGLEAVSMSRVGERLGFTTMALYRHVHSKNELIALMVEEGLGLPRAPDDASLAGWRAGLERWAWELLAVVRRHPWALDLPLARLPFGPNRSAWLDHGLGALSETALSEHEKAALVLLLNDYVFSHARLDVELGGLGQAMARANEAATTQGPLPPELVAAERFPALHRALDAGIFDPSESDRDADFAFGLERILDGIECLVAERTGGKRE